MMLRVILFVSLLGVTVHGSLFSSTEDLKKVPSEHKKFVSDFEKLIESMEGDLAYAKRLRSVQTALKIPINLKMF